MTVFLLGLPAAAWTEEEEEASSRGPLRRREVMLLLVGVPRELAASPCDEEEGEGDGDVRSVLNEPDIERRTGVTPRLVVGWCSGETCRCWRGDERSLVPKLGETRR